MRHIITNLFLALLIIAIIFAYSIIPILYENLIITIEGNLFSENPLTHIFTHTTGGYNVIIHQKTSSLTQTVSA